MILSYQWYTFLVFVINPLCMSSTTKIVLGMMAAAAAGAAIGVLFAPEKGSELRKRIKDNFDGWLDELNAFIARASETEQAKAEAETEY
jgi:gas vesicle protein